ncbi:unnamed protein product [Cylindrotheca closterium]|uniref:Telomerase Cajal body protein 1 n=1 Tax=Cylindrotheca closterium TaxID=2856 RepID=A0AAD2GBZ1_9STRA|nr:unnamed protein product [Cylindrotheca closterium]
MQRLQERCQLKTLVQAQLNNSEHFAETDDFYQGVSFSPDALCLLTCCRQNGILLFNTCLSSDNDNDKNWKPALEYKTGDAVRQFQWYPQMQSNNPPSCCFLGVSRDQPVHLYDAYTGQIRATYRPYNLLDELDSPAAFCFLKGGQHFVTGGFKRERALQIFDVARPGRDPLVSLQLGKTRKSSDGQKGLVSSLQYSDYHNIIACGTYSPGSIYLYDARAQSTPIQQIIITGNCVVGHGKSHSRKRKHFNHFDEEGGGEVNFSSAKIKWFQSRAITGVTQLEFADDGTSLFSLSRRSNAVIQWDLRKLTTSSHCPALKSYETDNDTNQRLEFALHQNHLFVGGRDNCLRVYDCCDSSSSSEKEDVAVYQTFDNSVNGISITNLGEKTILASATGSRSFPTEADYDDDDDDGEGQTKLSASAAASSTLSIHELPNFLDAPAIAKDGDDEQA